MAEEKGSVLANIRGAALWIDVDAYGRFKEIAGNGGDEEIPFLLDDALADDSGDKPCFLLDDGHGDAFDLTVAVTGSDLLDKDDYRLVIADGSNRHEVFGELPLDGRDVERFSELWQERPWNGTDMHLPTIYKAAKDMLPDSELCHFCIWLSDAAGMRVHGDGASEDDEEIAETLDAAIADGTDGMVFPEDGTRTCYLFTRCVGAEMARLVKLVEKSENIGPGEFKSVSLFLDGRAEVAGGMEITGEDASHLLKNAALLTDGDRIAFGILEAAGRVAPHP